MIHAAHCITRIHCVACRQDPAAYDAPVVCPYGVTAETATTYREGVKMNANQIKAAEAAYHVLLRSITDQCKACGDNDDCVFTDKRSCERRRLVRQKAAVCPAGKWTTRKK